MLFLFTAFFGRAAAQNVADAEIRKTGAIDKQNASQTRKDSKSKIPVELEEKALALLKTMTREAGQLNLPENRIRYFIDAGDLMWSQDQKTARGYFKNAISDFRLVLQALDALYQKRESGELDNDSFFGEDTASFTRFYSVQRMRQNMLLTIAKHDAQLALDFLHETARENFKDYGWRDASFEPQLAIVVAKNDPNRAFEIGQQKIAKNSFEGLNEIINNLYEKDAEKGANLASETVKKLRTTNLLKDTSASYIAVTLFDRVAELEKNGKNSEKALLDKSDMSQLAETVAKTALENYKAGIYLSPLSPENLEQLKKYAPLTTAQLEQQIKIQKTKAAKAANGSSGSGGSPEESEASPSYFAAVAAEKKREDERKAQTEAMTQAMKAVDPNNEKISVDEAKQALAKIKSRSQRFIVTSQAAHVLAERGEKEAAGSLLTEINNQQIAQPRRAVEMLQNLFVAKANSNVDPERSFTTLEAIVYELNSVISAGARLGEFFGIKEMMDDNEFAVAGFANEMLYVSAMGQQFGAEQLIVDLAKADFERTVELANKLERPEIRLEVRMLIVRALLATDNKIDKTIAQAAVINN